jgi:hypothetical protein
MAKGVLFGDAPSGDEETARPLPTTESPPLVEFDVGAVGCLAGFVLGVIASVAIGALIDVAFDSPGNYLLGPTITILSLPVLAGFAMTLGWRKGGTKVCTRCGSRIRSYRDTCSYCGRQFTSGSDA